MTMAYSLNSIPQIDGLLFDAEKRSEIAKSLNLKYNVWKHKNGVTYHILKYDKDWLVRESVKSIGLLRSLIFKDDGTVVCFAPPKSLHTDDLKIDANADKHTDYVVENFIEGTMINVFYETETNSWEIATRSSVGVFSNFSIIYKACDIMIYKCKKFIDMIEKGDVSIEVSENTTISNEYTITLKNEDYTLGNVIVYLLYEKYYSGDKSLSFVGFRVPHPHIPNGVIRLAFEAATDTATVSQYLTFAAESVITAFTNIQKKFKE